MIAKHFSYNPLPHTLIYAGSIPFIAGAVLLMSDVSTVPLLGNVRDITAAYGLLIAVFLTGIHWGQELSLSHVRPRLFISSNLIALIIWLSWLLFSPEVFMAMLTLPYLVLLYIDLILCRKNFIDQDYYRSRLVITLVVICSLLVASLSS